MDWSKMDARERDALVAEKVMGCNKPTESVFNLYPTDTWVVAARFSDDTQHLGWIIKTGTNQEDSNLIDAWFEPKPFTTEIGPAWEVVEKMRGEYDGHFTVMAFTTHWKAFAYTPYSREDIALQVSADTAPEAICLAALRAKGADV